MSAELLFNCPKCGQSLQGDPSMQGTEIICPECRHIFICAAAPPEESGIQPQDQMVPALAPPAPKPKPRKLIVTTGNEVVGQKIVEYLGIVRGIVVRSPTGTESLFGGLKQIVGGNIETYAKLCEAARNEAYKRMAQDAQGLNADAVIAFRYDATEFQPGVTEVLAYGTAVKLA